MIKKNTAVTYPGAFAGKTGYTSLAGNTLVTCAKRDGITLIAVVLNGHQTHYRDTKAMLDFGFSNFQSLKAADHETAYPSLKNDMTIAGMTAKDSISLSLDPNSRVILPKDAVFSDLTPSLSYELDQNAPENAIARISYSYDGHEVGKVYLCTAAPTAANRQARSAAENQSGTAAKDSPHNAETPDSNAADSPQSSDAPGSRNTRSQNQPDGFPDRFFRTAPCGWECVWQAEPS